MSGEVIKTNTQTNMDPQSKAANEKTEPKSTD